MHKNHLIHFLHKYHINLSNYSDLENNFTSHSLTMKLFSNYLKKPKKNIKTGVAYVTSRERSNDVTARP